MPLVGGPRKTDPPRSLVGGRVVYARRCGDPCVLLATYGSAAARREGPLPAPRPRRPHCNSGSPAARTGGTARICFRNGGSVGAGAPPLGASENSTAASRLPIISTETMRLHSAGRSGGTRVARLTLPSVKPPSSQWASPVSGLRSRRAPEPGDPDGKGAQLRRWGHLLWLPASKIYCVKASIYEHEHALRWRREQIC